MRTPKVSFNTEAYYAYKILAYYKHIIMFALTTLNNTDICAYKT